MSEPDTPDTPAERDRGGRKPGYKHTAIVRQRIRVAAILTRLHAHVAGEVDMTPTQVRAAEVLLKKALPDLSAVELSGEGGGPVQIQRVERVIVRAGAEPTDG